MSGTLLVESVGDLGTASTLGQTDNILHYAQYGSCVVFRA